MKKLIILFLGMILVSTSAAALDEDTARTSQERPNIQDLASQGDAQAQLELGVNYEKGIGVDVDFKKAAYWYQKSADQGSVDAQNNAFL